MNEKILSAYVTNLGKYTEGELVGKWLDFPTTQTKINLLIKDGQSDSAPATVLYKEKR